ncbi:hypothetical protein I8J29_15965 [Paenibacillus sp. MWE-103]|uniref:Uncharacterized protein n=1 Tax=Paenibacillus artemisiicola TaxID=1172618 RepID=A0ABS3WBQ9_9BACL|nr:hypothetical protein [Paenibacillus artemisiicola]MBO7745708.1 hypothetical protein [Paenibacillus artemisiicola]
MKIGIIIGLTAVAGYALLLAVYGAAVRWDGHAAERRTAAFLKHVQGQRYQAAARAADASERAPERERGLAEVRRMGLRLAAYRQVSAEYDDGGYNTGHARLTWELNGRTLETEAILTFGPGGKPRQVCAVTPAGRAPGSIPALAAWNRVMCGSSF